VAENFDALLLKPRKNVGLELQGMDSTSRVRIGLIGVGRRMSAVVHHLIQAAPGRIEVAAVFDPAIHAQQGAREQFGASLTIAPSEEAILSDPSIEWVFIGSMNHQHAGQAIRALQAGKHVFCEKPLATNLSDCLAVRREALRSGRIFSFGLVLRYAPHYQKIRELIQSGAIGRLISFEFNETLTFNHGGYIFGNWRRNRDLAGTHLLEKCCHDLDLANWITGQRPVRVASFGGRDFFIPGERRQVERIGPDAKGRPAYSGWHDPEGVDPFSPGASIVDNQVVILEYSGGTRATFHTNCNAAMNERRFYLCGSEGTLRADAMTGVIEIARIGHGEKPQTILSGSSGGHAGGDEVMAQGLAATLLEGRPPLATVDDGILACIAAFGIDQALDSGQVVDLRPMWDRLAEA